MDEYLKPSINKTTNHKKPKEVVLDFIDKETWSSMTAINSSDKEKLKGKIFEPPKGWKKPIYKYCLIQSISKNSKGETLEEPIVIVRGFFETYKEMKQYVEEYQQYMRSQFPNYLATYIDLWPVPVNVPIYPWYSRSNIKNIISKDKKMKKRREEEEKRES